MARILQQSLFSWQHVSARSDLDRLRLVLDNLPDEDLMNAMENRRGKGRNNYPIRAVWNSLLAGIVFQHPSIEQLRRELMRNAELRHLCGFDIFQGEGAVPPSATYSRFMRVLFSFAEEIDRIFDRLIEQLRTLLPDLGTHLAYDGKPLDSAGKPTTETEEDGRRDTDADWGKHVHKGVHKNGKTWEKITLWFGYKLHMVCDVVHELPLSYTVTKASASEYGHVLPLVASLQRRHPTLIDGAQTLLADRGLDSKKITTDLYDEYDIKPVIDIRNCWHSEGDEVAGAPTRQVFSERCDNIMYDFRGHVYCHCPVTHKEHEMTYGGFEKTRHTLKYLCPVKGGGAACAGATQCPHHNHHVRIPLSRDRRVFTPVARSSYKWRRHYNRRSAVERLFSRLDVSFGWERHFVRGLKKMKVRVGLSLIVMLAMALGHMKSNEREKIRSLVKRPELVRTG